MPRICSIESCDNKHKAYGFCEKHADRLKKYGDPLAGPTPHGEPMRWIKSMSEHKGDECLIWPYSRNKRGYASMRLNGKTTGAYRMMCEIVNGPPTHSKNECAHSCGKGHEGCINPNHLRWANREENQQDRFIHGTDSQGARCGMSKLSDDKVKEIILLKGKFTTREIAKMYGVHNATISSIHLGKSWRHITS